jgi:DNA-binding NarL/FixJ family response regulator
MALLPQSLPEKPGVLEGKQSRNARTAPAGDAVRSKRTSPTKTLTKVLIVHGSPVTRFGLSALLRSLRCFRVCAQTDNVPEARELFGRHRPDVAVIGLSLRHGDGVGLIKDFKKSISSVRTLVLSDRTDMLSVQRAFRAGARGYMVTHDDISEIPRALTQILVGEFYASPSVARLLLHVLAEGRIMPARSELTQLSDRELQIFGMIGRGLGASRVARELHLSVKTIETHRMRIKQKLGLRSGADLNRRAENWLMSQMRKRDRAL